MKTMNRIIPITICTALILVSACEKLPVASFTVSTTSAVVGDTIYFQNTSEGANTFDWDFGDGNGSTEKDPSHIYTAESTYTINLEVTNADGSDEASMDIWIIPPPAWTTLSIMPTPRWDLSTCVVDKKIYVIGGGKIDYQSLSTVEVYDPATDTWTTKSDMPTARLGLSASVVDGKIYAIGGTDNYFYPTVNTLSTVEEYDPMTDTWTKKADLHTSRGFHSANVLDGKIYIIGGSSAAPFEGTAILTVEVYDPATDTWTQKGNIPRRIGAGSTSVVDEKIYAFGGYGGLGEVHQYNPVTDKWTQKTDMPTIRCGLSTSVLDGKIYAIGGHPGSSPHRALATVEAYNPSTDTWETKSSMLTGRAGVRTSVVDGKIYAFGGYTGDWLSAMCLPVVVYYE